MKSTIQNVTKVSKQKIKQQKKELQKQAENQQEWFKPASNINKDIESLPVATLQNVYFGSDITQLQSTKHKAIEVNEKLLATVSNNYELVQHKDAFRPVIEGLTQAGAHDFKYRLHRSITGGRAYLDVVLKDEDMGDTCRIGFRISNSFDKSLALNFGFKIQKQKLYKEDVNHDIVTVYGFRQVCQNGLIVKVPLETEKFVTKEIRQKLKTLISQKTSLKHLKSSNIDQHLKAFQYITEGLALLKQPINAMITAGQELKITTEEITPILKRHLAERYHSKIVAQFQDEQKNLWGLYNAITHVASHDSAYKEQTKQLILEKAANMLTYELTNN